MSTFQTLALLLFFALNLNAYILMYLDKQRSKERGRWRISEKKLLLRGYAFGSLGIIAAMFPPLRHKRNKPPFRYGMPLAFFLQSLVIWWFWKLFTV